MDRYVVILIIIALSSSPVAAAAVASLELSAAAAADDEPSASRALLQVPLPQDCARKIPKCIRCVYEKGRAGSTVTRAHCKECEFGYTARTTWGLECSECLPAPGRAGGWRLLAACHLHLHSSLAPANTPHRSSHSHPAGCSPGFFLSAPDTCTQCGYNSYCPGLFRSAPRFPCGTNKLTTTEFARTEGECLVRPGYGWAAGDGSAICDAGFYNAGRNKYSCARCGGGRTTAAQGANSSFACLAPPGHSSLRDKAIACAQGFYKTNLANADCTACPDGWTTKAGEVAKTAPADCTCEHAD
jgi:hypothetical protein